MVRKISKKSFFRGPLGRQLGKWGRNILVIWMTAPLQYLLIIAKVVALEKVSFSNTENPKTVC